MNEQADIETPMTMPEKLALAQRAFREFHARCFWFMRENAQITEQEIPYICERLRRMVVAPVFCSPHKYAIADFEKPFSGCWRPTGTRKFRGRRHGIVAG